MNLVEAELHRVAGHLEVRFGGHRLRCPDSLVAARPALAGYAGRTLVLGIRPEHFEDAAFASGVPPEHRLTVNVDLREALGSEVLLFFTVASRSVVPEELGEPTDADGTAADHDDFADQPSFVARVNANSKARHADTVELTVDVDSLQFFDAESGLAIYGEQP